MEDVIDELLGRLGEIAADAAEWAPDGSRPALQASDALRLVELMLCVGAELARGVGAWLPDAGAVSDANLVWSTYLCSLARRLEAEPLPVLIDSLDPPEWPGDRL